MATSKHLLQAALAGVVALSLAPSAQADTTKGEREKCFGVAKKGQNDCGTAKHACAAQGANVDNNPTEWKYVAKGTCDQLGGMSAAPKA